MEAASAVGAGRRATAAAIVWLFVLSGIVGSANPVGAQVPGSDLPAWAGSAGPEPVPWKDSPTIPVTRLARDTASPPEPEFPKPETWTVDLGAPAKAGDRPVVVSPGRQTESVDASLEVTVLGRDRAEQLGAAGFVFTVADRGAGAPLPAELSVDYSGFAGANGGDFAARLKVVALPDCVLADPLPKGCDTAGVALPADNDLSGRKLRVRVEDLRAVAAGVRKPAPAAPERLPKEAAPGDEAARSENGSLTVLAVTAGTESELGTYRASPMAPSSKWNVSTGTGDFTYSPDPATRPTRPG